MSVMTEPCSNHMKFVCGELCFYADEWAWRPILKVNAITHAVLPTEIGELITLDKDVATPTTCTGSLVSLLHACDCTGRGAAEVIWSNVGLGRRHEPAIQACSLLLKMRNFVEVLDCTGLRAETFSLFLLTKWNMRPPWFLLLLQLLYSFVLGQRSFAIISTATLSNLWFTRNTKVVAETATDCLSHLQVDVSSTSINIAFSKVALIWNKSDELGHLSLPPGTSRAQLASSFAVPANVIAAGKIKFSFRTDSAYKDDRLYTSGYPRGGRASILCHITMVRSEVKLVVWWLQYSLMWYSKKRS